MTDPSTKSRALVLSGGGPLGLAWHTGVTAALGRTDVDLGRADFILGTSAGASVGALIALGRDLDPVLDRYRRESPVSAATVDETDQLADDASVAWGATGPMAMAQRVMTDALSEGSSAEEARAAVGSYALDADTFAETDFLHAFRYLRGESWPRRYACTAVDAGTGEFVVWDADNPAELQRAVASSCSVPGVFPPVTIEGRPYIDGGFRSAASADLTVGYDRVLIVTLRDPDAPTAGNPHLERRRAQALAERTAIQEAGGQVMTLTADAQALAVMGSNPHDASRSSVAAAAGFRQGQTEAARVLSFWH